MKFYKIDDQFNAIIDFLYHEYSTTCKPNPTIMLKLSEENEIKKIIIIKWIID